MKRILAFLLAGIIMLSAAACGTKDNGDKHTADNTDNEIVNKESDGEESNSEVKNEEPGKFELTYPESMTAQGYETLVLDKAPNALPALQPLPFPRFMPWMLQSSQCPPLRQQSLCLTKTPESLRSRAL